MRKRLRAFVIQSYCFNLIGLISDGLQCSVPALISLELLNYMDPILSPVALQGLPSLKFLTVQYRDWSLKPQLCHLKTWLSKMPLLSELNISCE